MDSRRELGDTSGSWPRRSRLRFERLTGPMESTANDSVARQGVAPDVVDVRWILDRRGVCCAA